jgi:hypothetical protein
MTWWTAHTRRESEPVLIPERFSLGALIFGPLWLALHRAWIPAGLVLAADVLNALLMPPAFALVLNAALAFLLGLFGHDLRRWSIERRGYLLTQVLTGRDETEALARLLRRRPDLATCFMPPEAAR